MSKANATRAIKELGKYYTDAVNKINSVRSSTVYSDEYKAAAIDRIVSEYNAKCDSYKAKANDAIKALQSGLTEKRHAEIKKGLEAAETVNNIVNGIKGGIYSSDMMRDLVSVHADNAYATKTIRGALMTSNNDSYKAIALEIPLSNDDRICSNLDNIIRGISEMPSPTATENGMGNFNVGLYQSGQNFDSWAAYIDSNIDE